MRIFNSIEYLLASLLTTVFLCSFSEAVLEKEAISGTTRIIPRPTCPSNLRRFSPLAREPNADELKINFYYDAYYYENQSGDRYYYLYDDELRERRDDDWGRTDDSEMDSYGYDYGDVPKFDDSKVKVEEDGIIHIAHYPWTCEKTSMGCIGPATLRLFPDVDNNLKAGDKVYIKDTSSDDMSSFLVSWEGVQFKDGTGEINVQAEFFDNGAIQLCYGEGDLSGGNIGLDLSVGAGNKAWKKVHLPEGTSSDVWPEGQCFCYSPGDESFVHDVEEQEDACMIEAYLGFPAFEDDPTNSPYYGCHEDQLSIQRGENETDACSSSSKPDWCTYRNSGGDNAASFAWLEDAFLHEEMFEIKNAANRTYYLCITHNFLEKDHNPDQYYYADHMVTANLTLFHNGQVLGEGYSHPANYYTPTHLEDQTTVNTEYEGAFCIKLQCSSLCECSIEEHTSDPSPSPSVIPSAIPSNLSSASPSSSTSPTSMPFGMPSASPSSSTSPTSKPSFAMPSASPSDLPTGMPTGSPSGMPTGSPSGMPTGSPSGMPTGSPSVSPSGGPSTPPSSSPSGEPSFSASTNPSDSPTVLPSNSPSESAVPTFIPSSSPSMAPFPYTRTFNIASTYPSLSTRSNVLHCLEAEAMREGSKLIMTPCVSRQPKKTKAPTFTRPPNPSKSPTAISVTTSSPSSRVSETRSPQSSNSPSAMPVATDAPHLKSLKSTKAPDQKMRRNLVYTRTFKSGKRSKSQKISRKSGTIKRQRWYFDSSNRLRLKENDKFCVTSNGGDLFLRKCDDHDSVPSFFYDFNNKALYLQRAQKNYYIGFKNLSEYVRSIEESDENPSLGTWTLGFNPDSTAPSVAPSVPGANDRGIVAGADSSSNYRGTMWGSLGVVLGSMLCLVV